MEVRETVLIVDDVPENIDVLSGVLQADYKIKAAINGEIALKICAGDSLPDIILLDVMMPGMDGYQVCEILKSDTRTKDIPVIFVTAKGEVEDEKKGLFLGAIDYITKPVSPAIVKSRDKNHLNLYDQRRHLESLVKDRTAELELSKHEIIMRLGRAAEYKDNETGMHVRRMSLYTELLAGSLGLSEEYVDLLLKASPMHDVGKIGIPYAVLLKPGKLEPEEWEVMKTHPQIGANILGEHKTPLLNLAREIALSHHEKWDGSGYPDGLQGESIPLSGRIVAITDVFDALTTARPYKEAWDIDRALAYIQAESGRHFDPSIVPVFMGIIDDILEVRERYKE
ncbi:MAG: two-component system response regulator [Cellvibrionaceae bacterium]|nr:two-component system response regulator [Cellvibrionaceae bacterium]|tara:strand:- start:21325 stop:22344 length:1020 start_codon:yes stop_codon:yes gene_type:complete